MAFKRVVVALLGCGLMVGACDDSTEVAPGAGAAIPFEEMPQRVADALCAAYEQCLGDFASISMGGEDCQTLFEARIANDSLEQMSQAIDAGTATYHGDQLQACLDALAALGCDALLSNSVPECHAALAGTVTEGGDCAYDVECVGDLYCQIDGSCPGSCTARGGPGAGCDENDQCEPGLLCLGDTSTCAIPAGQGDSCGQAAGAECGPSLICMGADDAQGTPGTCSSPAEMLVGQEGDSCDILAGPWCQIGTYCAVIDFVAPDTLVAECVATAPSGGDCHLAAPDMCPDGEFCEVPAQSLDGSCVAIPRAGEPCADNWTKQCAPYHRCVDGTCRGMEENGATCADDAACYSAHCDGGVCGPYAPC